MTEEDWTRWAGTVAARLWRKSHRTDQGCIVWDGAKTKARSNATPYGYLRLKVPGGGERKTMRVHVLAYLVESICVRELLLAQDRDFDISHRCHNSLCINFSHLSAEERYVNNSRKTCHNSGQCQGHQAYEDCIFV
ncbi:hypothetical protein HOLleu_10912 [Holothuria leucospilota]|uniref:Zinc-binding loop region of homing endonuclease domain-containing protein n=1 Tax=Holothuria leucospilota TaxID=206669 RepID=A0A9Q1CEZ0_HOLLE|nr:hypothetical protein HOLleu_10912 [Holothuria leucospilota]